MSYWILPKSLMYVSFWICFDLNTLIGVDFKKAAEKLLWMYGLLNEGLFRQIFPDLPLDYGLTDIFSSVSVASWVLLIQEKLLLSIWSDVLAFAPQSRSKRHSKQDWVILQVILHDITADVSKCNNYIVRWLVVVGQLSRIPIRNN